MKISEIISSIDNNQLFVPVFQREYVWKRENVKSLFDSLIKGYPFGTMLTWSTNNPPKMKGNILYDNKMGAIKLILDGIPEINLTKFFASSSESLMRKMLGIPRRDYE